MRLCLKISNNAKDYTYLRVWEQSGRRSLSIGMVFTAGSAISSINCVEAVVTRCDGKVLETETDDSAGTGQQDHVKLPAGFEGWVAFPVAEEMVPYYTNPLVEDLSAAASVNFDMRPGAPSGMEYYVFG